MPENYRIFFVLRVHSFPTKYDVEMYESETGAWRHCTTVSNAGSMCGPGVYWNGAVYLLDVRGRILFSFDLKQEWLEENLLLPMIPFIDMGQIFHLEAAQGDLHLFSFDKLGHIRVFQMNRYRSHLSMKLCIRHDSQGTYGASPYRFRSFMGDDGKLFVFLPMDELVFIYDTRS